MRNASGIIISVFHLILPHPTPPHTSTTMHRDTYRGDMTATALAGAFVRLLFVIGTSFPPSFPPFLPPSSPPIARGAMRAHAHLAWRQVAITALPPYLLLRRRTPNRHFLPKPLQETMPQQRQPQQQQQQRQPQQPHKTRPWPQPQVSRMNSEHSIRWFWSLCWVRREMVGGREGGREESNVWLSYLPPHNSHTHRTLHSVSLPRQGLQILLPTRVRIFVFVFSLLLSLIHISHSLPPSLPQVRRCYPRRSNCRRTRSPHLPFQRRIRYHFIHPSLPPSLPPFPGPSLLFWWVSP